MNLYQVRYNTAETSLLTDWYFSITEARKEALNKNMPIESEIVELKIVGHEAMAEAIQMLINAKLPFDPSVRFVRNLGSAKEVKKRKIVPLSTKKKASSSTKKSETSFSKNQAQASNVISMKPKNSGYALDENWLRYCWESIDLSLTEIPESGVLVEQHGRAYLAKNQTLSSEIVAIIETSIQFGFGAAIQKGHPRTSNLLPRGSGVGYLSLGLAYDDNWVISVQTYKKTQSYKISINKKYDKILDHFGVDFNIQRESSDHPEIGFLDIVPALQGIKAIGDGSLRETKSIMDRLLQTLVKKNKRQTK